MGFSPARLTQHLNTSRQAFINFVHRKLGRALLFSTAFGVIAPAASAQSDLAASEMPALVFILSLILVILLVLCIALMHQNRKTVHDLSEKLEEQKTHGQTILHRVSNNIQVLTALIRMEQRRNGAQDPDVTDRLLQRIETMAAMHQLIDLDGDETIVLARPSLERALDSLIHRLPEGREIDLHIDNVTLPFDKAFKLALLISEVGGALCDKAKSNGSHNTALNIALSHVNSESLSLAFENIAKDEIGCPENNLGLSPIRKTLTDLLVKDLGADPGRLSSIDLNKQFGVRITFNQPHELAN